MVELKIPKIRKMLPNTRFLELVKRAVEKSKQGRKVEREEPVAMIDVEGKVAKVDAIMIDAMGRETKDMIDVEAMIDDVEEPTWVSCSRCS